MNFRFMRLLLFFDLPMETSKNRADYGRFRKFLVNNVVSASVKQKVAKNLPPEGVVEMLEVTENQFSRIDYLVGEKQSLVEESMDRVVEYD